MKICTAIALCLVSMASAGAQPTGVQRLVWLQGCWALDAADRTVVEEQWMAPRGGVMLGMSRTVRGDRLVAHESVILREQGEQLAYEVIPSGQSTTVFLSTAIGERSVVFENLQHDFPQRVAYQRNGTKLLASIEGTRQGQTHRVEYPYQQVGCGPG